MTIIISLLENECYFCKMKRRFLQILFLLIWNCLPGFSQNNSEVKIEFKNKNLELPAEFELVVEISNDKQYDVGDFPDLKGLKKGNRSIKHSQVRKNNKNVSLHQVSQIYIAESPGKIIVPAFNIEINGKSQKFEGTVLEAISIKDQAAEKDIEIEEVDFVLECSESDVYVGQGFNVSLGLYLSDNTTTEWQFPPDIGSQVEALYKRIKPEGCLESRVVISNIIGKKVQVRDKMYTYYGLMDVVFYPLNPKDIRIGGQVLNMQKKTAGKWSNMVLKSNEKKISVKTLPEHPLKEKVPVGILRLSEQVKGGKDQNTGKSFEYQLRIDGEANFKTVSPGDISNDQNFDFYLNQSKINQSAGSLTGNRIFSYKILPKTSGDYDLGNVFRLIYFDVFKEKYDTLVSNKSISVSGSTISTSSEIKNDIYWGIEKLSTDSQSFNLKKIAKYLANFLVAAMVLVFLYILKKKN